VRRCGAEEETSTRILCECEALATVRQTYLDSFFLNPKNIRGLSLGGNLVERRVSNDSVEGTERSVRRIRALAPKGLIPSLFCYFLSDLICKNFVFGVRRLLVCQFHHSLGFLKPFKCQ